MRKYILGLVLAANILGASDHAMIVGCCSEYQDKDSGITLLKGTQNDARHIKDILIQRGVSRDNIDYLVEKDATYKKITKSIKSMESKDLQKGDKFYLFYSGHGTSVEDRSSFIKKIESDAELLDRLENSAGLIPYDFDMNKPKDTLIITSRDFKPTFRYLDKKGVEIVWIVDACFAGNAHRSMGDDEKKNINLTSKSQSLLGKIRQRNRTKGTLYKNLIFYGATVTSIKTIEVDYMNERRGEFSVEVEKCLNRAYPTKHITNAQFKHCLKKSYANYVFSSSIYPLGELLDSKDIIKVSSKASITKSDAQNLFDLDNNSEALELNIYSLLDKDLATDTFCKGEELAIETKKKSFVITFTLDNQGKVIMLEPNSRTQGIRTSSNVVRTVVQAPFGKDRVKIFSTENKALYKKVFKYKNRKGGVLSSSDIESIFTILKSSNEFQTASMEVKTIETDVRECRKDDR